MINKMYSFYYYFNVVAKNCTAIMLPAMLKGELIQVCQWDLQILKQPTPTSPKNIADVILI